MVLPTGIEKAFEIEQSHQLVVAVIEPMIYLGAGDSDIQGGRKGIKGGELAVIDGAGDGPMAPIVASASDQVDWHPAPLVDHIRWVDPEDSAGATATVISAAPFVQAELQGRAVGSQDVGLKASISEHFGGGKAATKLRYCLPL